MTDTSALGTSQAETTTIVRQASGELPTSITDALGRRTDIAYDPSGNVTTATRLAGTANAVTTTMTYEPVFNQVKTVTDPLSHTTTYDYYADGSLKTVTDPLSKVTTFTDNVAGQPLTVKDPTNKTTTFEYAFGDQTAAIDPLGAKTKRYVDAAGRVASVVDPMANLTKTDFDALNRPTKVTDPLAGLTQFTYDPNGNILTLSDPRNGVTTYTYDSMDRVATRKDPLLKTESYIYDGNGNLTKVTDRLGLVTTYQYDPLNRKTFAGFKTQGTSPNFTYESTIGYTYDAGNRTRTAVDSLAGTVALGYDDLDRLTSDSSPQGTTSYGYDNAGRQTSMTLTGQPQVTYLYDNADRLTLITQGAASVASTYDDAGRLLTSTLPNGFVGTYTYDDDSHIKTLTYTTGSTTIGDLSYTYDASGHRTTAGGSLARVSLPTAVSTTTYNADNQLTKWASTATQPTYDLNGNMLADGTYTYTWNARHQLTQVKQGTTVTAAYGYDALGRRISKTLSGTTTGFAYQGGNFIQEKNGSGTPTANLLAGGTDQTFSRTDSAGARYFLTDALGSSVGLVDGAGTTQTSYTYEPYGKTTVTGSSNGNAQQFTGRENDGPLYYYRARYYNPTFGRFISEDTAGQAGSGPNLYVYADDDPVIWRDPTGKITAGLCFSAAGVLGFFGAVGEVCLVGSSAGELGVTVSGGGGGAVGAGVSGTIGFQGSTADRIDDLGGPFVYAGARAGFAGSGSVNGFQGRGTTNSLVTGGEVAVGVGEGASWMLGFTATKVFHIDPVGFFSHFNPLNIFGDDQGILGRRKSV